ncbi:MAG: two-component system, NarL family, sensor kinase [Solirubrobacteraceae bacterium]|jgi:signal transduction histidine kinase|nr:two-component system, NarL family, sensor kinase [Solirubrobacteraceae bacterium]
MIALALAGALAVSVIGLVLMLSLRNAGVKHELREAEGEASLAGKVVIAPLITPALLRGDRTAYARLDRAVRTRVLPGPVTRVKLWASDGRIVYSDEVRLVGLRFPLQADERKVLASGGTTRELSDLDRPENRFESGGDRLLEVYTQVRAPDGTPMLFEAYHSFDSIASSGRTLGLTVLPALIGGLLVLELANLAIAAWFARYTRRTDQQRAALLARALDASNAERRRIAADLHDGVVQDLTAVSMAVDSATRPLHAGGIGATTVSTLDAAADTLRQSLRALRTLLSDFYPADLEARGLPAALGDLVAVANTSGVVAELEVPPDLRPPAPAAGLLYRVAQEALRNATTHARAGRVIVAAGTGPDRERYWLEVRDDGEGFDTEQTPPVGHIGLRAVRDLVVDAGGGLSVRSKPGEGCVVRAELPGGLDITRQASGR